MSQNSDPLIDERADRDLGCVCVFRCLQQLCDGFPGGSVLKNPPGNAEDWSSIPGSESSPGEWNGYPLQHSCLGNSWTEEPGGLQSVGVTKSRTRPRD